MRQSTSSPPKTSACARQDVAHHENEFQRAPQGTPDQRVDLRDDVEDRRELLQWLEPATQLDHGLGRFAGGGLARSVNNRDEVLGAVLAVESGVKSFDVLRMLEGLP